MLGWCAPAWRPQQSRRRKGRRCRNSGGLYGTARLLVNATALPLDRPDSRAFPRLFGVGAAGRCCRRRARPSASEKARARRPAGHPGDCVESKASIRAARSGRSAMVFF
jgi:hypothetical protein